MRGAKLLFAVLLALNAATIWLGLTVRDECMKVRCFDQNAAERVLDWIAGK